MIDAGLRYWQILPLNPTAPSLGNSPYSGFSAFAIWELYASPAAMKEEGLLDAGDLRDLEIPLGGPVDYPRVMAAKKEAVDRAFAREERRLMDDPDFRGFMSFNGSWLDDYALFAAAKADTGGLPWTEWPEEIRLRRPEGLERWGTRLARQILRIKYGQHIVFRELTKLKARLGELGIRLIGDAPFYVSHDSADVWARRDLFLLDPATGETAVMAGVPPDYYSEDGQLWGNPVYDWPRHREEGYAWWTHRILHNLGLFDWTRLDHFRAFSACWTVPAGEATARNGRWMPGPGGELFGRVSQGDLNIVAEDLGVITPDVTLLRKSRELPGMRVLQFGAGDPTGLSIHCPFRVEPDNLVYPSTHDSNTSRGWYRHELDDPGKKALDTLAGFRVTDSSAAKALVTLAWMSPGAIALATVQDLLGLDETARINVPGTATGNWEWRMDGFTPLNDRLAAELAELTAVAGRDDYPHPNILTY
jgi:4-alpha-glucanotransferase